MPTGRIGESDMDIVVLAGGNSTERDVSLVSGKAVYEALKSKGHNVVLLDVFFGIEDVDVENIFEDKRDWALHGANGEDGRIQAALDLMQVKYSGTDYLSSAICMDKSITKELFRMNGIRTPKAYTIRTEDGFKDAVKEIGFPMVVKAPNGGSSVGVYIVDTEEEAFNAMKECFKLDNHVLFEQYIKGREFTCGVIDGKALPIVEIEPVEGFYDYKNKYQAGSTVETCPAKLDEDITLNIQKHAEEAFKALHIKTYARIDFLLNEQNEDFCLEANTIPGMTPMSLIPQEAKVLGIDFPELCEKIIEISLKKY